jgi:hypothetical protein
MEINMEIKMEKLLCFTDDQSHANYNIAILKKLSGWQRLKDYLYLAL